MSVTICESPRGCGWLAGGDNRCTKNGRCALVDGLPDPAINPAHYRGDAVMRVIEEFNLDFCSGAVVKYLLRAGQKPGESVLRDHEKALWYLQRKIENLRNAREAERKAEIHEAIKRGGQ